MSMEEPRLSSAGSDGTNLFPPEEFMLVSGRGEAQRPLDAHPEGERRIAFLLLRAGGGAPLPAPGPPAARGSAPRPPARTPAPPSLSGSAPRGPRTGGRPAGPRPGSGPSAGNRRGRG